MGFDSEEAQLIAAQTARGAASLLLSRESHPEIEIDKVTTPEGCTIAGLQEVRRRDVVDVHQEPRPKREQAPRDFRRENIARDAHDEEIAARRIESVLRRDPRVGAAQNSGVGILPAGQNALTIIEADEPGDQLPLPGDVHWHYRHGRSAGGRRCRRRVRATVP